MTRLSLISLTLILLTASAFAQPATSEPTHDGKPLSHWLKSLEDSDANVRAAAAEAIGKMGEQAKSAVPALIKATQDQDARAASAAVVALGEIGPAAQEAMPTLLKELSKDKPPLFVHDLATAMGRIRIDGPETRVLVRSLLIRDRAKYGDSLIYQGYLAEFPAASIRHSVALLKDEQAFVRSRAAEVLGRAAQKDMPTHKHPAPLSVLVRAGEVSKEVVPALLESLKDKDAKIRREVVLALHKVDATQMKAAIPVVIELLTARADSLEVHHAAYLLAPVAGEAAPKLIEYLMKDDTDHVRAAETLARLPYDATAPLLIKALSDPSARIRKGVAYALGRIGTSAGTARAALIAIFNDPEREVRLNASVALSAIDPKQAQPALPNLIAALGDNDLGLRSRAVDALRKLGTIAGPAVASLLPMLKDPSPELRFKTAEALVAISREQAAPTVPILAEALKQDRYRSQAVVLAGRLGSAAQPLLPTLLPLLKHKDANLRLEAAEAVVYIDRAQSQVAVPVIAALFKDKELMVTVSPEDVLDVLHRLGPEGKAAAPALLAILKDPKASVRLGAQVAFALVKVDPTHAETAITFLRQGLKVQQTRQCSLRALEQLGSAAKSAVPDLTELLKDDAAYYRERAARALGQIGPDAKAAVPALKTLLRDEDEGVRQAAREALKKIDPSARNRSRPRASTA